MRKAEQVFHVTVFPLIAVEEKMELKVSRCTQAAACVQLERFMCLLRSCSSLTWIVD